MQSQSHRKIRVENERISHRLELMRMMPSRYGKRKNRNLKVVETSSSIKRKKREEEERKEKIRKRIEVVKPTINVRMQEKLKRKKRLTSNQYIPKIFQGASPLEAAELGSTRWVRFLKETKARLLCEASARTNTLRLPRSEMQSNPFSFPESRGSTKVCTTPRSGAQS